MKHARLIIAIVFAVVCAQFQCLAVCAGGSCRPESGTRSLPPCHHAPVHDRSHERTPASCAHVTVPSITAPQAVHYDEPSLSIAYLPDVLTEFNVCVSSNRNYAYSSLFPPGHSTPPTDVLRI